MATRTVNKILADIVAAFRTRVPALGSMGMNFGTDPLYLGQTVTAHVEGLPTIADYDGTTGYANGATELGDLLTDIPVVIDGHKHVPVKLSHLNAIADEKKYTSAVGNQAYVLGKAIVDSVLAKVKSSSISYQKVKATASVDYDTLTEMTGQMNDQGAALTGRRGIVSTAVMNELLGDTRIASGDYHGQRVEGSALRQLVNIAGFEVIDEYPDFPTNNATGATFTAATTDICTLAAHGFKTGDRVRVSSATTLPAGLSAATDYYVIWVSASTFKLATTRALAVAGTAVDITDTGTGAHTITGYENLTGFFFEERAFALKTGLPSHSAEIAAELGIPQVHKVQPVQDPESMIAVLAIMWQQSGKLDIFATVTALWGSAVGAQSGVAGTVTDKAGLRLISA
jgi:hypothetical protein